MKFFLRLLILPLIVVLLAGSCQSSDKNLISTGGPEVVKFNVLPFGLDEVTLLEGPFKRATELSEQSLLNYEPDRLLARFRIQAGLEPKAPSYGGWEAMSLAGHSLGHYLTASVLIYQSTGNEEFLRRANYIVDQLAECQEADGEGYIGAFSRGKVGDANPDLDQALQMIDEPGKMVFTEEIAKGYINAGSFSLNDIWAPFYTQHKILAGLHDAYKLLGNQKALEISKRYSDWLYGILSPLSHETIQEMLICEYGGINESFVELYGLTGDEKYLRLSRIFHDDRVMDPLASGIDALKGLHANTQIPKITGLARRYELTGDKVDYNSSLFFWDIVVNDHTYVTGGNCNEEYFGAPGVLRDRLGPNTTETCNVYNMLRLTHHLFQWDADAAYADYYERALLNHIYASQHPHDGRVIYNLNIDMGGRKSWQNPFGFTCCVGTGMESHSHYGRYIYYRNNEELYVAQFIASELDWKEKGVKVRQTTAYPEEQGTTFEMNVVNPVAFTLQIRYPSWAENGMDITVNGSPVTYSGNPGSFVGIDREWNSGDVVEVKFPYSLRLENMPDDKNRIAVFNGPVLLAGVLGPQDDTGITAPEYVPIITTSDRNPANWLSNISSMHHYKTTVGQPRDVEMVPFYSIYDNTYTLFFDMMTVDQWQENLKKVQQRKDEIARLNAISVDLVSPGDRANESANNLQDDRSSLRNYKERTAREGDRGGWFSYDMKISGTEDVSLVLDYWGGFEGTRTFDIFVDNVLVATENVSNKKAGHFIYVEYKLPIELTRGKEKVRVQFGPDEFNRAGPVFTLYTVKSADIAGMEIFNWN